MGKKLYVGNLTYRVSSSDLEQLFSEFGSVDSAEVISDRDTGRSKGFGFVEMSNDNEAGGRSTPSMNRNTTAVDSRSTRRDPASHERAAVVENGVAALAVTLVAAVVAAVEVAAVTTAVIERRLGHDLRLNSTISNRPRGDRPPRELLGSLTDRAVPTARASLG